MGKILAENKSIIILLVILIIIIASLAIFINSISNTESIYSGEQIKKDSNIYEEANEENLEKYKDDQHAFLINRVEDNYDGTLTVKGRIYNVADGKITDEEYNSLLAGEKINYYGDELKIKDLNAKSKYSLVNNYDGENYCLSLDEEGNPVISGRTEGLIRIKGTSKYMKIVVDDNIKVYREYGLMPDLQAQYGGTAREFFETQDKKDGDDLYESIIYKNDYYNEEYIWLSNKYEFEFENEKCIKIIEKKY